MAERRRTATSYALSVTNAASGLSVTDGAAINLVDVNGDGSVIVGVVQAGGTVRRPGGVCDLDQQRHRRGDG